MRFRKAIWFAVIAGVQWAVSAVMFLMLFAGELSIRPFYAVFFGGTLFLMGFLCFMIAQRESQE